MQDWLLRTVARWTWHVQPEWQTLLFDEQGFAEQTWLRAGCSEVMKHSPQRTVTRVRLPQGTLYVKHDRVPDWRARARQWLRVSKARGEAERAWELARRGVATITPLAIGEHPSGASILVTAELTEARSLRDLIENQWSQLPPIHLVPWRQRLAQALATFLARAHREGVEHRDLHAGNVLARIRADELELFLVDLHAVKLRPALDWLTSRTNLLVLNRWFVQRASRADRLRFWQTYVAARTDLPELSHREHEEALDLEADTWTSCLAYWRQRTKRCLGKNKYFFMAEDSGGKAWASRALPASLVHTWLGDPEKPLAEATSVLKHSRSSTVACTRVQVGAEEMECVYKRFVNTQWSDAWTFLTRPTPALKSWINGHRLRECGLATPQPLAVFHKREFGLTQASYLLTEKQNGVTPLNEYWARLQGSRRTSLVEELARLVRELHRRQVSHRDLKAANVLVDEHGKLWLVDLVGMETWRSLPWRRRVRDLARLHVSALQQSDLSNTDKLRFLRIYSQWGLKGQQGWKDLWRAVAAATKAKLAKNLRRARPVS